MAALYRAERRRIGEAEYQSWFLGEWTGTGRRWLRDNQGALSPWFPTGMRRDPGRIDGVIWVLPPSDGPPEFSP